MWISCPDEQVFVSFIEGALDEAQRQALHEHLDRCPACSELVIELAHHLFEESSQGIDDEEQEQLLPDRYQRPQVIGAGGMGIVYKAWDSYLERFVAIKTLRAQASERLMGRLWQEARSLAKLRHPHILPIYDVGLWRGQLFLVMPFFEGGSLGRAVAKRASRPSWRALVRWFVQAAQGISAAHKAGLIHRDLKPDNLLLSERDEVLVADFGLAKGPHATREQAEQVEGVVVELHQTRDGAVLGTPLYMAPEQHLGLEVDARTDQFSLCASLFELLYGCPPFEGDSYAKIANAACIGKLVNLDERQLKLAPAKLHEIITKGLKVLPNERHADMDALIAALEQLLALSDDEAGVVKRATWTNITWPQGELIGRASLVAPLADELASQPGRLITLTGVAGVGKTRQALAIAQALHGRLDALVFVDLRSAKGADELVLALAAALGVGLTQQDIKAQLIAALEGLHDTLLILDNAEHVLEPLRDLVQELRAALAARVRFLITSRRRLALEDEHTVGLETLPLEDAKQLLVERALGAWSLTDPQLEALAVSLDGLPLAIELAASRARTLSVAQIYEALHQRFALLKDRHRAKDGHHGALDVALSHSWALLDALEQRVLSDATIFTAPFDLEQLGALYAEGSLAQRDEPLALWELAEIVDALMEWSLIRRAAPAMRGGDETVARFEMLVSVREFCALKLEATRREPLMAALATSLAQLGAASRQELAYRRDALPTLDRLMVSFADLDAALSWASRSPARVGVLVAVGAAVADVVGLLGWLEPGIKALARVLACDWLADDDRAWFLERQGRLFRQHAQIDESERCVQQALALSQAIGDLRLEGICLGHMGALATSRAQPKVGEQFLEQALAVSTRAQDERHEAIWRGQLGIVLRQSGRVEQAVEQFEQARAMAKRLADWRYELVWTVNLGTVAFGQGRLDEALSLFESALSDPLTAYDAPVHANLLLYRATLQKQQGRFMQAQSGYEEALRLAQRYGLSTLESHITGNLGGLYVQLGRYDRARQSYERALVLAQRAKMNTSQINALLNLGTLDMIDRAFGAARARFEEALAMSQHVSHMIYEVEARAQLAMLQLEDGDAVGALNSLDEVLALAERGQDGRALGIWGAGRGYVLGVLGRLEEAREALDVGIGALEAAKMKPLLAQAICWRGEVEAMAKDRDGLRGCLARAQALATELGSPQGSQLGQSMNKLRESLLGMMG